MSGASLQSSNGDFHSIWKDLEYFSGVFYLFYKDQSLLYSEIWEPNKREILPQLLWQGDRKE